MIAFIAPETLPARYGRRWLEDQLQFEQKRFIRRHRGEEMVCALHVTGLTSGCREARSVREGLAPGRTGRGAM